MLELEEYTHAVVLGAALGPYFCGVNGCILLTCSLLFCQIVAPFRIYVDIQNILPHAKRRDDLLTLREAEHQQSVSSKTLRS